MLRKNKSILCAVTSLAAMLTLSLSFFVPSDLDQAQGASGAVIQQRRVQIANALRRAAKNQARSRYWVSVANSLNKNSCNLAQEIQDAATARSADFAHANVQRNARLALSQRLSTQNYDPSVLSSQYGMNIDNIFFPIVPGRTLFYTSTIPQGTFTIERNMLEETVLIDGVTCRVVRDIEKLNDVVVEETDDFYAKRTDGAVWYFGEIAKEYKDGFLDSLDGSWRAGKDDAKPGVAMPAKPQVGDLFRQEYFANGAEDATEVISTGNTVSTPAGTFFGCLEVEATSPMEPAERERKFFAPHVGLVKEINLGTGAITELTKIVN